MRDDGIEGVTDPRSRSVDRLGYQGLPARDLHRVRLARLQEVTSAFSRTSTPAEVCDGAIVRAAATVGEAMRELGADPPDVLVSDIGMPDADGYALIRAARELAGPDLPAIALTADARREDRERAVAAGFDLHLPKPVEPNELVRAVARLAGR